MKIIYTILFFVDTLLLTVLAYLLLKLGESGLNKLALVLIGCAIVFSIVILFYILFYYIKLPSTDNNK